MSFVTDGTIGTSLAAVSATQKFALGKKVTATDGGVYVYVQANGAISQYDCVAIDEDFQIVPMDNDYADDGHSVGFAQLAFADDEYGFVAVSGSNINCSVITGTAADAALYADSRTSLAGQLQSLTSLGTLLLGVVPVAASNTSTSVAPEIIANYPKSSRGIAS